MSSCCDSLKPSPSSSKPAKSCHHDSDTFAYRLLSFSPLFTALLHSSCCWLPAVLDLTSIGSASAASVSHLRPFFSAITFLVLIDSIRRQGFTRHNLLRALVSGLILLLPTTLAYFRPAAPAEGHGHSCHHH